MLEINESRTSSSKHQRVQLILSASGLTNVAGFLQVADPYAVVSLIDGSGNANSLGKTEVIQNSLDPVWIKVFEFDYEPGNQTKSKITIFHEVPNHNHKNMGSVKFDVRDLLQAHGNVKSRRLKEGGAVVARVIKVPAEPSGTIKIAFQGIKLRNGELYGLADPFFELSRMDNISGQSSWLPVFRSEQVWNSLDPIWKPCSIDLDRLCDGDRDRPIMFSLYDFEKRGKHKRMGWFETTVNELISAKVGGSTKCFDLTKNKKVQKKYGNILVCDASIYKNGRKQNNVNQEQVLFDNTTESEEFFHLKLRGIDIKNVEFGGKSDPFFEISRIIDGQENSKNMIIFRSSHINDNLNPNWDEVSIKFSSICNGDKNMSINLSVYDYQENGFHREIGSLSTTVNELLAAKSKSNSKNVKSTLVLMKKRKMTGRICVENAYISKNKDESKISSKVNDTKFNSSNKKPFLPTLPEHKPPRSSQIKDQPITFVDYITGGCELQLCFAIDFGSSNGNPRDPKSLHYLHRDGTLNEYEKAINEVGSVISKYDPDQMFPVWGFGGEFGGKCQHCFQVGKTPEVQGIKGVSESYRGLLRYGIGMGKRSVITEVVENAASYASWAEEDASRDGKQCYTILLILTDGSIDYARASTSAIAKASRNPLSIVIVGLGDGDFNQMRHFDDFMTKNDNFSRDITQFVEFKKHRHTQNGLVDAVFEEIPEQVVGYFQRRGIKPKPSSKKSHGDMPEVFYQRFTNMNSVMIK